MRAGRGRYRLRPITFTSRWPTTFLRRPVLACPSFVFHEISGTSYSSYQTAAVKIAAHHLNKRGGVLIGDVVGLGKTLMATALARIFEDDHNLETLIICPKKSGDHVGGLSGLQYRLQAKVMSISRVITRNCPTLAAVPYRCILDESHNLRNREGKRYRVIQDYIQRERKQMCSPISHALQQDLS